MNQQDKLVSWTDDELIARVLELYEDIYSEMSAADESRELKLRRELCTLAPDLARRLQKANERIRELEKINSPEQRAKRLGFDISKVKENHSELDLITRKRVAEE